MIKRLNYLFIIIILTNCQSEKNCPGFPEQDLSWIPYKLNKEIQFSNGIDTTDFVFKVAFVPQSYNTKDDCWIETVFETGSNNELELRIEIHSYYWEKSTDYNYWFLNSENSIDPNLPREYLDEFNFAKINGVINKNILNEIEINDNIFKNVISLELDTNNLKNPASENPRIWKIMIADSIGLIQFYDRSTHINWTIIK